jgi:HK97 family phage portal protein
VNSYATATHTPWSAASYAAFYRTQPNIRICVDFLARNLAQLGCHVFRRVSDTDRLRAHDHQLQQTINHPFPGVTRYKLFESLMQDLGIYFCAFWLKVKDQRTGRLGLLRLPPETVEVSGWLRPDAFFWYVPDNKPPRELDPSSVVYFHGFNPDDPIGGLSPIETLRQTLAEESAASAYRAAYWTNAARFEGIIERPATAKPWTPEQKQAFREQWQMRYSGVANAGMTPVLDEGMTFRPVSHSARESEYIGARKLSREECAAAYHIPQPMVGILDHATFSNVKEQHKQLYQDSLGPWCAWISEEIELQVLSEFADQDGIYTEFNIAEKMKGSFEDQAVSLARLVGRPIMTANEGRARLNLPAIHDDPSANALAAPLNMTMGAETTPSEAAPEESTSEALVSSEDAA